MKETLNFKIPLKYQIIVVLVAGLLVAISFVFSLYATSQLYEFEVTLYMVSIFIVFCLLFRLFNLVITTVLQKIEDNLKPTTKR